MNFKKWFEQNTIGTDQVDERQLNVIYDKAKYAVQLVRMYDRNLLKSRGDSYELIGKYPEAVADYSKFIALNPDDAKVFAQQ